MYHFGKVSQGHENRGEMGAGLDVAAARIYCGFGWRRIVKESRGESCHRRFE